MTGKRLMQAVTAAAISLAMVFTASVGTVPAAASSSLNDLKQQQTNLKKEQNKIDSELQRLQNDKTQKTAYKATLDKKIAGLEDLIGNEQNQVDALDKQILQKQKEIAGKQLEVNADFAKLKERVRALYLTGEASSLEIILNAKNIMDLADKSEILKVIAEHDTSLMNKLKDDIETIKVQKAAIDSDRAAVAGRKAEVEEDRRQLAVQSDKAAKAIADINADQKLTQADQVKNAEEQKKADAAVDKWFADYYASHRNNNGGGAGGYKGTGNFTWPVPSCYSISSPFGSRWSGAEFHKGIDISGGGIYGAEVDAADGGTVIEAESGYGIGYLGCRDGGGYGNHVYIDHGNGYYTIYGHLSRVRVSTGQTVTKGQQIGNVGSSGSSTGAHLHFEIRLNGVAKNPLSYFSR